MRARQWAEGRGTDRYAEIGKHHPRAWDEAQADRLRELAGTMDRRLIADVLTREFPAWPRSAQAVAVYASRNGISLWPPGHSLTEIGLLLGVTSTRVRSWIDLGWLEAFPYVCRAGPHSGDVRVTTEALETFLRHHADHYDGRRVQGTGRLAELARSYAARKVPVRFSKPHPRRAKPWPEPTWFGIACAPCQGVTFSRCTRPTDCHRCGRPFESVAA